MTTEYAPSGQLYGLTLDQLTEAYAAFCEHEALPHIDAMELALTDMLDAKQKDWLVSFILAWDLQEEAA